MLNQTTNYEDVFQDDNAVVYFTATWCQPCKALKPQYARASVIDTTKNYYMFDVDKLDKQVLDKYKIMSVPQIFLMNKGEVIKSISSRVAEEIVNETGENNEE